jgi:ABC-type branched-subunit amino acid transport system substrate-binding protein
LRKHQKLLGVTMAVATLGAGCVVSATTAGASSGGAKETLTIGVITDESGEASSGNQTTPLGVKAGTLLAAKEGYQIKYVVADTATSPTGALTAAQKLVEEDHVSAVVGNSAVFFGAAPYLTTNHIPVIGVAEDGGEWTTSNNMFSVFGFLNPMDVSSTAGLVYKGLGAHTMGTLGYGISPSSADSAKGTAISAQAAGLKVGYLNANFPFGSTNVAPEALAMKTAGVDGVYGSVDPNTAFALISALRQDGGDVKVAVLPDGYGGDLSQAGPGAISAGQGLYFELSYEPVEMHTAATEQFQSYLKKAGVTGLPTYAEYNGYISVVALVDALKTAGKNPTTEKLISSLAGVKNFNAAGLLGSHSFNLNDRTGTATGIDSCEYLTKLSGHNFNLVKGMDPLCGKPLPGKQA